MFSEFANNIFELDGLMAETIIFAHDDAYIVTATIAKEIEPPAYTSYWLFKSMPLIAK